MPRPSTPLAKARVTGAVSAHPERFRPAASTSSNLGPIDGPPDWLTAEQTDAWRELVNTLPWLDNSHRGITSIAAVQMAKLRDGTASMSEMNLLRLCLGQMGATPADARRVAMPAIDSDDPADEYFESAPR